MLDLVSKWGPWLLAALAVLPAAGIWRVWHSRHSVSRRALIRGLIANVAWLVASGMAIWTLQIRMAPLTGSLVTLQAQTGKRLPEIAFRRLVDDRPHHLRELEGNVIVLNLWAT